MTRDVNETTSLCLYVQAQPCMSCKVILCHTLSTEYSATLYMLYVTDIMGVVVNADCQQQRGYCNDVSKVTNIDGVCTYIQLKVCITVVQGISWQAATCACAWSSLLFTRLLVELTPNSLIVFFPFCLAHICLPSIIIWVQLLLQSTGSLLQLPRDVCQQICAQTRG